MIFLAGLIFIGVLVMSSKGDSSDGRLFGLPDIFPEEQGGDYKTDFDLYFEKHADRTGVPFGLLKAHALKESSLNPRAFRDENPTKRTDRLGWASRGLLQLLAWPGTTRWAKFGFSKTTTEKDLDALYDPDLNISLAADLIKANLTACQGNLRDAVNMYNAGVKESVRQAPGEYVNKVLKYYSTIIKRTV